MPLGIVIRVLVEFRARVPFLPALSVSASRLRYACSDIGILRFSTTCSDPCYGYHLFIRVRRFEKMAEELFFGRFALHPDQVFFTSESGSTLGIVNICPTIPGHVLVIPRRVVARLSELSPDEVADLFLSVQRIGRVVERHNAGSTSLTVTLQDGKAAGQTVQHVHVHILPRREGDFRRNDEVYEALHDLNLEQQFHAHTYPTPSSIPGNRRSIEEMAEEAKALRAHAF